MKRLWRWSCGLTCAVAVLMGGARGQAAEGQMPSGQVWAEAPVQPWDETTATGEHWAQALNQEFSLARKGKAGEQHRYQFRRQNLLLDRQGRVMQRTVFEGALVRTLQEEKQPSIWAERLQWERFGMGQSQGPNNKPVVKELPGAKDFAFDFFPPTFNYLNPPGDYTRLGDPMAGYGLKVAMMDVCGFDALLMFMSEGMHGLQIGQTVTSAPWQQGQAITATEGAAVAGQYSLGAMTVSVAGLTRRGGEPCLLLWFTAEGNDVTQDVDNPQIKMHMKATEYFRGTMAVSLRDGRVVGGELWGPLPGTLAMGFGGQPAAEQPTAGFMGQVSLWEMPAAAAQ